MLHKQGFTLIEIIVVLVIMGVCLVLYFPSYTTPLEQGWAATARNNLLAIYSAEQNYYNNNNGYCNAAASASSSCTQSASDSTCANSLAAISCNLSLNIQDTEYSYSCAGSVCLATRLNSSSLPQFTMTLNAPIQLNSNNPSPNPVCAASTGNSSWCP